MASMVDRTWVSASRLTKQYKDGVKQFIDFALQNGVGEDILFPCVRRGNMKRLTSINIENHLYTNEIDRSYTKWIWHGEGRQISTTNSEQIAAVDGGEFDNIEDMLHATREDFNERPEKFEQLLTDAHKPLYNGCSKFAKLSTVLKLYNLKASNGWTDTSFTALLELLKEMLPDDNVLLSRAYEAKKILSTMGLSYEKIHACPNDCILYRNENELLERCPNVKCQALRYKKPRVPAKVLWYFPIIPRFRRMFGCKNEAKNLTWHEDERIDDGKRYDGQMERVVF